MTKKELRNYIQLKKRLLKDINKMTKYLDLEVLEEDELKSGKLSVSDILEFEYKNAELKKSASSPSLYDVLNFFQACNDWWGEDIENAEKLLKCKDIK